MEAVPKVHRQRHRRSSSRRTQERNNAAGSGSSTANSELTTAEAAIPQTARERRSTTTTPTTATTTIFAAEEGLALAGSSVTQAAIAQTRLSQENERQNSSDAVEATETTTTTTTPSLGGSSSQQTVVLVNGYSLPDDDHNDLEPPIDAAAEDTLLQAAKKEEKTLETTTTTTVLDQTTTISKISKRSESPQPNPEGSSRNSSGDAMSLRETLQQLQPTVTSHAGGAHNSHPRHHRRRTSHSPQSPAAAGRRNRVVADPEPDAATSYFHRGIIGFMDREIKTSSGVLASAVSPTPSALSVGASGGGGGATKKLQSLSDPTASPAQRSTRSRSSLEKSPRRKRSKSESRRRRERKLIAAGEMEVRQANETLMRYLKQCSEMNDASLSGELEIDQNFDERRVHRKTKSQRDKRGHLISKLYSAGGLSSILKELSDDIVPADGEEIYNPFTPVVSPTEEDTPAHIDKMFIQTSSGYRPVDHCYYKHSFVGASRGGSRSGGGGGGIASCGDGIASGSNAAGGMTLSSREAARLSAVMAGSGVGGMRGSGSYSGDTRCLLDAQCRSTEISSNLHLACVVQRIWLLVSNICHGLLAGLALAHLLFVITSHPMDWSKVINDISLAGEATLTQQQQQQQQMGTTSEQPSSSIGDDIDTGGGSGVGSTIGSAGAISLHGAQSMVVIADYAAFAEIYANTFYCLAIVCLVSVFDRMDICHLDLSNATELVSFRWIIIAMIYIATIILSICSNSIDEKLYFNNTANVTLTHQEMLSNQVLNVWNSLSVARSLGAIFGWLMIGLTPHDDLLYEHLLDLAQYQTNN